MNGLYRGKRKDNGTWVEGYYTADPDLGYHCIEYWSYYSVGTGQEREYIKVEVIPETVGQFTGLCDKKGIKIFEGDICKGEYGSSHYENEVLFVEGCFSLKHGDDEFAYCAILNEHDDLEITGNIHKTK